MRPTKRELWRELEKLEFGNHGMNSESEFTDRQEEMLKQVLSDAYNHLTDAEAERADELISQVIEEVEGKDTRLEECTVWDDLTSLLFKASPDADHGRIRL